VRVEKRFDPDSRNALLYDNLFEIFSDAIEDILPLSERLTASSAIAINPSAS